MTIAPIGRKSPGVAAGNSRPLPRGTARSRWISPETWPRCRSDITTAFRTQSQRSETLRSRTERGLVLRIRQPDVHLSVQQQNPQRLVVFSNRLEPFQQVGSLRPGAEADRNSCKSWRHCDARMII